MIFVCDLRSSAQRNVYLGFVLVDDDDDDDVLLLKNNNPQTQQQKKSIFTYHDPITLWRYIFLKHWMVMILNIVAKSEKSIFDWLLNIHRNIKEGEEESLWTSSPSSTGHDTHSPLPCCSLWTIETGSHQQRFQWLVPPVWPPTPPPLVARTAPPQSGHRSGTAAVVLPASRCWVSHVPSPQGSASRRSSEHGAFSFRWGWWELTLGEEEEGAPPEVEVAVGEEAEVEAGLHVWRYQGHRWGKVVRTECVQT